MYFSVQETVVSSKTRSDARQEARVKFHLNPIWTQCESNGRELSLFWFNFHVKIKKDR